MSGSRPLCGEHKSWTLHRQSIASHSVRIGSPLPPSRTKKVSPRLRGDWSSCFPMESSRGREFWMWVVALACPWSPLCELGASKVDGVDIDRDSIEAARSLLSKFNVGKNWSVETANLLWLDPQPYDVVYSWGVLHHTGEMWRALERVIAFVRPGGLLAVAIYRRTPACAFWKREKKFSAPRPRLSAS